MKSLHRVHHAHIQSMVEDFVHFSKHFLAGSVVDLSPHVNCLQMVAYTYEKIR